MEKERKEQVLRLTLLHCFDAHAANSLSAEFMGMTLWELPQVASGLTQLVSGHHLDLVFGMDLERVWLRLLWTGK